MRRRARRPLRVMSGSLEVSQCLPVCPRKRTSDPVLMSHSLDTARAVFMDPGSSLRGTPRRARRGDPNSARDDVSTLQP